MPQPSRKPTFARYSLLFIILTASIFLILLTAWRLELAIFGTVVLILLFGILIFIAVIKNRGRKTQQNHKIYLRKLEQSTALFRKVWGASFIIGGIYSLISFVRNGTPESALIAVLCFGTGAFLIVCSRFIAKLMTRLIQ